MVKFDIISVGSGLVDAFVYTNLPEVHKEMCYKVGSKIAVPEMKFYTGGGGTNTAVSFSKLGLKTGWLGKIGKDTNGEMILKELSKNRVVFLGCKGKENTGFSVILDSKEHERTVLTYKGASDTLKISEVNFNKLKTKWFYFSSMAGSAFEVQKKLVEFAKKNKIKIAFNPSSYLTEKGAQHLKKIMENTEIIILNEEEAKMLILEGDLFSGLHKLGPKIVCITYGPKGNEVSDGKNRYLSLPHNIKIKERTGAGDAFASAFVAGYIKTKGDIKFAIQAGSLNAESVVMIPGAKNGLLTWKELEKKIKTSPVKIIQR